MKHYESISSYNDMLYDSRPVAINEYLVDKYNIIHKELFNDALNKYLNQYISKYINIDFLHSYFELLNTNEDYVNIFKNIEIINTSIYNSVYNLEININKYLLSIIDILDNHINVLIEYLLNNKVFMSNNLPINEITLDNIKDFRIYKNSEASYTKEFIELAFDDNCNISIILDQRFNFINTKTQNTVNEIIDNINKNIMKDVFNKAIEMFKKSHRIIEIKNTEYWMPSNVIIIHNGKPFTKIVLDLTDYWNNHQKLEEYDISKLKISNENILDSEVTYLDYIKGTAQMYSRSTNTTYEVPFKYLNEDSIVSEDMKLDNTFSHLI